MKNLILADSTGKELRFLLFDRYDFEVGKSDNSFEVTILRDEYKEIPEGARIYIPNTEYGGIVRRLKTNTAQDIICPGGYTWRGMLEKKIICPPSGQDYATDSGELNAIIKARVEAAFPGLFVGVDVSTGVTVNSFQYDRYCTLEAGLTKLLKACGYRLNISYSQPLKAVVVSAVPIVDYSQSIELSSDMRTDYTMQTQKDGVNHLICLGKGELRNRTVYHLYVDTQGRISTTQTQFGVDEIVEVFDYSGGELTDLIQSGREKLEELMSANEFNMNVDADQEIGIGDIVGGRDYLSGMIMTAPIAGKIVKWENGMQKIDYKLEDDDLTIAAAPAAFLMAQQAEPQEAELQEEAEEAPEEELEE